VPHLLVFVLSRFLLGLLNGLHMSLASAYIKESFPAHIRKPLGAIYSTCRIFGMLICYFIAEVSGYTLN
jgi:MFS family permease